MTIHRKNSELSFTSRTFIGVYNTGINARLSRRHGIRSRKVNNDNNVKLIWMSLPSSTSARNDNVLMNGDVARTQAPDTTTTTATVEPTTVPPPAVSEDKVQSDVTVVDVVPMPPEVTGNSVEHDGTDLPPVDIIPPPLLSDGDADEGSVRDTATDLPQGHSQDHSQDNVPSAFLVEDLPPPLLTDVPDSPAPGTGNAMKVTISADEPEVITDRHPVEAHPAHSVAPVEKKGRFAAFTRIFKPWKWKRRKKPSEKIEKQAVGEYQNDKVT